MRMGGAGGGGMDMRMMGALEGGKAHAREGRGAGGGTDMRMRGAGRGGTCA